MASGPSGAPTAENVRVSALVALEQLDDLQTRASQIVETSNRTIQGLLDMQRQLEHLHQNGDRAIRQTRLEQHVLATMEHHIQRSMAE